MIKIKSIVALKKALPKCNTNVDIKEVGKFIKKKKNSALIVRAVEIVFKENFQVNIKNFNFVIQ